MIFSVGKIRKGVHTMHFGQDENVENIVCGTWAGNNMQWTDDEKAVRCRACLSVLNAALPPQSESK